MNDEQRPLLPSDRLHHARQVTVSATAKARRQTKRFLTSKSGHYSVLALVSLDVSSIFVDFILQLWTCEGRLKHSQGDEAQEVLGNVSLLFSCLFMVELLASIWAFGPSYFKSWFHCFDATVILIGFVIDALLKGVLEEIGSIVIVLRFWRVFKIIEELSVGNEEQIEPLQERLESVEKENHELRREMNELKRRQLSDAQMSCSA